MYTGWRRNCKYLLDRSLTVDEKRDALSCEASMEPSFDERGGLVALNSTYIEWIDRRFRARGSGSTFGSLLLSLGLIAAAATFVSIGLQHISDTDALLTAAAGATIFVFFAWFFYHIQWGIDFFQKVYYPIRFNRKNRMIYVYRDKRDGGLLQVPWDKVFFHVGYGMMNPTFCDIRGEVMEDDVVKDTFALGPYYPGRHTDGVHQAWAFICRYMEGGPEAVGPDPRDRYIENSLHGTWMDCITVMHTNYPPDVNVLTFLIGWPMIVVTTVTRWLVFKSCSMPRWPEDIEAACKPDSNDPNVWAQPKYMDQFIMEMPAVKARWAERKQAIAKRARDAGPKSGLAEAMSRWETSARHEDIENRKTQSHD